MKEIKKILKHLSSVLQHLKELSNARFWGLFSLAMAILFVIVVLHLFPAPTPNVFWTVIVPICPSASKKYTFLAFWRRK